MCLNRAKEITPEELKVYKVFLITDTGCLYSPYFSFRWGIEGGDAEEIKHVGTVVPEITGADSMYIHGDSFHSFAWLKTAALEAIDLSFRYMGYKYCVASCTIPADTKFIYEGNYGGGPSYASESLKIDFVMYTYFRGKKWEPDSEFGKKE